MLKIQLKQFLEIKYTFSNKLDNEISGKNQDDILDFKAFVVCAIYRSLTYNHDVPLSEFLPNENINTIFVEVCYIIFY